MKIAVSADGPNPEAKVGHKLGTSPYLVIIDPASGEWEASPNPGASGQRGAGVQAVLLAASKGVNTVITGYCSPAIAGQLEANGITVLTGASGTVREVAGKYNKGKPEAARTAAGKREDKSGRGALLRAGRSSLRQFVNLLPILTGVVLLIGLFNAFVSQESLSSIFTGNMALDTLWGACFGSLFAGNPINSYVIGGELLKHGTSLFAVTALIIAWVTVGLVQLPAEIAALGKRFALLRNGLSFLLSIPIAIITVLLANLIAGGIP